MYFCPFFFSLKSRFIIIKLNYLILSRMKYLKISSNLSSKIQICVKVKFCGNWIFLDKIVEYFTSNSRKVTGGCAGVWFLLGTSMASSRSCGFGATCPCSAILKSYHRQQFPVGVTNSILGWKSSSWTPAKNLSISYNYLHTYSTSLIFVQKIQF